MLHYGQVHNENYVKLSYQYLKTSNVERNSSLLRIQLSEKFA